MDATVLWKDWNDLNQRMLRWSFLFGRLGAHYPLSRALLVGLRGVGPFETTTHPTIIAPNYRDSFILLQPASTPQIFHGATYAYQTHSKLSPDVNNDGIGDVATISPGQYILKNTNSKPYPVFLLLNPDGSSNIKCTRDTNHNALIDDDIYTADQILFHAGFNAPTDSIHKSSIGCQTTDLNGLKLLDQATPTIDYFLTTAETAITHMEQCPIW